MKIKRIHEIVAPGAPHFVGDGFKVHNFIPGTNKANMRKSDPFIMLDYNAPTYFSATDTPRGVSVHPHRGVETVTIAYKGSVQHEDSSGGGGIIAEGDVQWMTAAAGILHKEYHEKDFSKRGGEFQMVQLWVNLPAKYKMSPPKYQAIKAANIPHVNLKENAGFVEVIAGEFEGVAGVASTFTPLHLYNAKMVGNGKATFSFPSHYNTTALVIKGSITVNDEKVSANHFVQFTNEGESFEVVANEASIVLILSGEPINEPIVSHGPFVMNTQQEIVEAIDDFNMGKFGYLE